MPKEVRRLGQDRRTPETISGVKGPERLPDPARNLSLDELLARTDQSSEVLARYLTSVPVSLIDVSPYQPRLSISTDQLQALADSIQTTGLLQPILVRPKQSRYELIGGERRWRAHQLLGWSTISAYVVHMGDAEAELGALADNEAHASLSDYERGKSFHSILSRGIESSQRALARKIGVNVSTVNRCLAFMSLPEALLKILDESPNLLGIKHVKNFAALAGQDLTLSLKALIKIRDEQLSQEAALRWAKQELAGAEVAANEARTRNIPGLGTLQVTGKSVQILCDAGINAERLMGQLEAFLQTLDRDGLS